MTLKSETRDTLRKRWQEAASLVAEHRDLLDERPWDGIARGALVERGWADGLLTLSDDELEALEDAGIATEWPRALAPSLLAWVERVREVCALETAHVARASSNDREGPDDRKGPDDGASAATRATRRREKPRKRAQVDAFADRAEPFAARAARIVDVGSGHGHLTREIAARLGRPVVGLERSETLARRAEALSRRDAATFETTDVLRDGLALREGDCVIALHACGELGDAIVQRAAETRASVVLVGCCLQKQRAPSRSPLCDTGELAPGLNLPKHLLGLSNLTPRAVGVEATRAENLAARERRLALWLLFAERCPALPFGAELDGLNRRAAHGDLPALVARAFTARRLVPPSKTDIEDASARARAMHARSRRLALPRTMLARALETFVLLDRARFLALRGFDVEVGVLFSSEISARNLVLTASAGPGPSSSQLAGDLPSGP